jgi:type II secretory pathway pseudopilin PulG
MESKVLLIAVVCLIAGVAGGYFVNSVTVQNQYQAKDLQLQAKDSQIQQLQAEIDELQATISTQSRTQVKIDSQSQVVWLPGVSNFDVTIRNTGTVPAKIQSISIRKSAAGSQASIWTAPADNSVEAERLITLRFLGENASPPFTWVSFTSYVVRVTTTTGYYYELTVQAPDAQAQTQVRVDSLTWDNTANTAGVLIRNTGSVACEIESISVRRNTSGAPSSVQSYTTGNSLDVGSTKSLTWTSASATPSTLDILASTSYVVRVTTKTGFYYEMVATTPA